VTIDGLARIFDHDSPWSINSETLDARATHPYPIPYSIRSYSFRDDPATYKRTIHNPWEPDVIHGLPPILGEEIKVRCSYETHPPETFTLTRYDRTDEALALLPPRVRIPFDLFWGVTASKRLSHTQVAAKLKRRYEPSDTLSLKPIATSARSTLAPSTLSIPKTKSEDQFC